MNAVQVRLAEVNDAQIVATLVHELVAELNAPRTLDVSTQELVGIARELLSGPNVWALLAESESGDEVGLLTLNECAAVYAGGRFG